MASSSQMKKEEAEFRRIAKESRRSRKEAAERQRRQRRRAAGAADVGGGRRRGVVVLPGEVAEMRQRLLGVNAADAPAGGAGGNADVDGGKKKRETKRQRKSSSSSSSSASPHSPSILLSSSSSLCPSFQQPPYGIEVHQKNKQVLVNVTLHHIPSVHVNVSETTDEMLVVDTSKHTKKYRLELPMPEGIRVSHEEATYELDAGKGVLKCVLPIKGDIPESLRAERTKMLDAMQKQKALRFRMGTDGELKVRSRRALLAKNERLQEALMNKKKESGDRVAQKDSEKKGNLTGEEQSTADDTSKLTAENSKEEKKGGRGKRTEKDMSGEVESPKKRAKKETVAEKQDNMVEKNSAQKDSSNTQKQQPPKQLGKNKKASGNVFDEEHKKAMMIAKSAGKDAQISLREKVAQAKALQRNMQERLSARTFRRETRSGRTQESFARILEEQKRQLLARAELNASIAAAAAKTGTGKKTSEKVVTFAETEEK